MSKFINGDLFENLADFSFGCQYRKPIPISNGAIKSIFDNYKIPKIFVQSEKVEELFRVCQPNANEFILISHNGDKTFTEVHEKPKFVVKWFGQNINCKNSKDIISLPIGLERNFWSQKIFGVHGLKATKIAEYAKKNITPKSLLYLNFKVNTNDSKRSWLPEFFKSWAHIRLIGNGGNFETYLSDILNSHFVLCPDGNGIDCHRNWEVLYLNRIPVLERSIFHETVYADLPVLIVGNFKEVSEKLLWETLECFKSRKFNLDKLNFEYWEKLINTK